MGIEQILRRAMDLGASDIFVVAGLPMTFKVRGAQVREEETLTPDMTRAFAQEVYSMAIITAALA